MVAAPLLLVPNSALFSFFFSFLIVGCVTWVAYTLASGPSIVVTRIHASVLKKVNLIHTNYKCMYSYKYRYNSFIHYHVSRIL